MFLIYFALVFFFLCLPVCICVYCFCFAVRTYANSLVDFFRRMEIRNDFALQGRRGGAAAWVALNS